MTLLYQPKRDLCQNRFNGENVKDSEISISKEWTDLILYIIILMIISKKYVKCTRNIWKMKVVLTEQNLKKLTINGKWTWLI